MAATRAAVEVRELARRDAEQAVAEAKAAAQREAEALLDNARAEAERLLAEGEGQRRELEAEAGQLRKLTDETSANLRSLLVGMLEQLEQQRTEPTTTAGQAEEEERDEVTPRLLEQVRPYTGEQQEQTPHT